MATEHPDYPRSTSAFHPLVRLELAPGEQKRQVELRIVPGASLSGKITDPDGDPVAGCFIRVVTDPSRPAVAASSTTDKNGEYSVKSIAAGRYYVQARCNAPNLQPRPFAPPNAILPGRQVAYGVRYYPDAPDIESAQKMPVAAGQSLQGLDFHLSPQVVSSLAVRVNGVPIQDTQGLQATLTPAAQRPNYNERQTARLTPQQNGKMFFAEIRPGSYTLRVSTGGTESVLLAVQPLEITEESKSVTVNAVVPAPLSGTVIAAPEKSEMAQQIQSTRRAGGFGRVALTDVNDPATNNTTEVKLDGSFIFRGVSPGRYRVSVFVRQQWLQSVALDGVTADGEEIEIKPGGGGTLEIRTGRETGIVSGDLLGMPANLQKVHIILTSPGQNTLNPNDLGEWPAQPAHYSLPIPPGHYRLYATTLGLGEDISSILGSENLTARGEDIDIRPGKALVRNIKVITAEDIRKETP